jgi:hypothetical protein
MRIISPLLILIVLVVTGCDKDKFTTIPQVSIESIEPEVVSNGNIISLKGEYTDKEGDVDSALIVYKWYNGTAVVRDDTFRYSFEVFDLPAKTTQADISLDFQYNTSNPNGYVTLPGAGVRDTTATLGILLIDKENNRSVYAESAPIRLKKP